MSSIAPSSMYVRIPARPMHVSVEQAPSRMAAAALLALASVPAIVFGGRPVETIGALTKIFTRAISTDFSSK